MYKFFILSFCLFSLAVNAAEKADVISSNPAALDTTTGTGALGEKLGFTKESGVRIGTLLIEDFNYLFCGGLKPKRGSGNSIFILSLTLDTEKLQMWDNGRFGVEYFQFNGRPTNRDAGTVQGYNSLTGPPPLDRSQLYQLWYRHEFFDKKLMIRIGKQIPDADFNTVVKPWKHAISATTGLIYTPIYVNPTLLGVLPGYYNSVYGVLLKYAPNTNTYFTYGLYDGNLARGKQTGLRGPQFNSYRFQIAELGIAWDDDYPGNLGMGVWNQSGKLSTNFAHEHGTEGVYLFGTQRLWWQHPKKDSSGVIGLVQAGINDSKTLPVNQYAGAGLTFFGLVQARKEDSFGFGLAFSKLNRKQFLRKKELILQAYYQAYLFENGYFVSALSYIPHPRASKKLDPAYAATARIILLF